MRHDLSIAAAVLAALAVAPAAAIAMDSKSAVDQAKAQGIVGEQADGFLGFVKPSNDPALKAAVDDINQGRAALYRQAAAKNGVPVEAALTPHMLLVTNKDKPGLIGGVGTILAEAGINIADFRLGRVAAGSTAISLISVDQKVDEATLGKLSKLPQAENVKRLSF